MNLGENYIYIEVMINAVLYAREDYKGAGISGIYATPRILNVVLLACDMSGRRIYSSKPEPVFALNVREAHAVEQFGGEIRKTDGSKTEKLLAIIANLNDYSLGVAKGDEVTRFT